MRASGDRSRRVLLLGAAGLGLTLLALGTAAWALARAEAERGRRHSAELAGSYARELLVALARTAAGRPAGTTVVLGAGDELLVPPPPRPFDALPPTVDEQAAFMLERAPPEDGDAALRLAAASADPVARLRAATAALRRGGDAARWYAAARIPASLRGTREAVWAGLSAGDPAARARALLAIGGADDAVAAALLLGTAKDDRAALLALRRRRAALAEAAELRTLFAIAPPIGGGAAERVLVQGDGGAFVATPRRPPAGDPRGAWWLMRLPPGSLQRVVQRLPGDALRVVARADSAAGESAPLPGGGGFRVVATGTAGASSGLLALGFAIAALAAVIAFFAFARAVLREARLARLRSEFVATVGHELRTPVAVIRSAAEALLMGRARNDDDRVRLIGGIVRESERLSGLLGNVLDFARMEAGRRRFSFAEQGVGDLVRDAVAAHEGALARAGITVDVDVCADLPKLRLDRDALSAALVNLLDNAAKFGRGEPVVVRAARRDDEVVIEVVDHGPGVPAAERARVFERFFRGAGETVRETRGTGIGLALVRHAAAAHGGRAEVAQTPGGGATFRIVLPVAGREKV